MRRAAFAWTGALFIVLALAYPIASELLPSGHATEVIKHLLLVLAAVTGAHILERAFFWRAMREEVRRTLAAVLRDTNALVKAASACGITSIWPARRLNSELSYSEELVREVEDAVRGARERVWLLGVALAEGLSIGSLLDDLVRIKAVKTSKDDRFDVRILLLDPLRSPAFFRSILENSPEKARELVSDEGVRKGAYFDTLLYGRFHMTFATLKCYEGLGESVRFYGSDPLCWLVIVDDNAYFEPYTFGRPKGHVPLNLCLGAQMPVFKFSRRQARAGAFEILESHFETLWQTSDAGIHEEESRQSQRGSLLAQMIERRRQWLDFLLRGFLASRSLAPIQKPDSIETEANTAASAR